MKKIRQNVNKYRNQNARYIDGNFECKICGKKFLTKKGLKTHQFKCPSRKLNKICVYCKGEYKKFGIKIHEATCKKSLPTSFISDSTNQSHTSKSENPMDSKFTKKTSL